MAKAIKDAAGNITGYEPGIIYDLGFYDPETKIRYPFYVGETTNKVQRHKTHIREGVSPAPDAEDKYHFIKQLNDRDLKWDIQDLAAYGNEGPADLEDEWVMKYLFDGITLTNMVRGSDRWIKNMEDREKVSADMKKRGISSYRKYKEILTEEERERQRQEKHAEWLRKEKERTEKERLQIRAEEIRQKLEAEMAERRAEQIERNRSHQERVAKIKADLAVKWEADRPAREARLRAEAEERQAREIENQRQAESLQRVLAEREAERMAAAAQLAKQKAEAWEKESAGFRQAQEQERLTLKQQADDSMIKFRNTMTTLFGNKHESRTN